MKKCKKHLKKFSISKSIIILKNREAKFVDKIEMDHDENQKAFRTKRKNNHARI